MCKNDIPLNNIVISLPKIPVLPRSIYDVSVRTDLFIYLFS